MRYLSLLFVLYCSLGDAIAQNGWKQTSGPEGGNVRSVAASTDGSSVVAGLWNGNLYRMTSAAPTWTPLGGIEGLTSLTAQGNILFAQSYSGLYQSYDFGGSWVPVVRGSMSTLYSPIVRGRDALYFIANDSVYRSTDAGDNWNYSGATGQSATVIGYVDKEGAGKRMFAAGSFTGFFTSTDRGETWTRSENGLPASSMMSSMATVHNANANEYTVWVSIVNEGVYYIDKDNEWKKECDGLPAYGGDYPNMSSLIEANGKLYGVTDQMVYEFDFSKEEWTKAAHLVGKNIQGYGGKLYSTSADGVELSNDGGITWTKVGQDFRFSTVGDFAVARKGVLAAAQNGVFRTVTAGDEWTKTGDFYSEDLTAGHGVAYAESLDGVRRSTDDGLTWELSNSGINEDLYHMSCVSANSTAVFAGFYDIFGFHGNSHWNSGGIYRSTDNGDNWEAVNRGLSNDGFADVPINKIEAFDDAQFALALDGLYRSTNNGDRWNKMMSVDPTSDRLVDLWRNGDLMILASMRSMFRSTDAGATWQTFALGLQSELENHQALLAINDTIYLKSHNMIGDPRSYLLTGETWTSAPIAGPMGVDVTEFFPFGSTLYAGSNENSVWTRQITPQASVDRDLTKEIGLKAYPNPFATSTKVSFTLAKSSYVRADLYDLTGRSILELESGHMPQGPNTVQIPALSLPEGNYLCRIVTESGVAHTQVVLLK